MNFRQNISVPTREIADFAPRFPTARLRDLYKQHHGSKVFGEAANPGATRFHNPLGVAMIMFVDDLMRFGMKSPSAVRLADLVMEKAKINPDSDQLTVSMIGNGAMSVAPTETVELDTGFISGGHLAFALVADLRGYSRRIDHVIQRQLKSDG
jgi:hypothetical protein